MMDSRVLHCGSANESEARRVLFYISFRVAAAHVALGTLDAELQRRKLRLGSSAVSGWCVGGTCNLYIYCKTKAWERTASARALG